MALGAFLLWGVLLCRSSADQSDSSSLVQMQLQAQAEAEHQRAEAEHLKKADEIVGKAIREAIKRKELRDKAKAGNGQEPAQLSKADSAAKAGVTATLNKNFVLCADCVGCLWKTSSAGAYECRESTSFEGANEDKCLKNDGIWCTGEMEMLPDPEADPAFPDRVGAGGRVPREKEVVPTFPFEISMPPPPVETTTMAAPSQPVILEGCSSPVNLDPATLGEDGASGDVLTMDESMKLPFTFSASSEHAIMFNNGNSLRVNLNGGDAGALNLNGGSYKVAELGFVFPSEHTVANAAAAGEMQIILRNGGGEGVIVSILLEEGEPTDNENAFFDKFRHSMSGSSTNGSEMLLHTPIDLGLLGDQLGGKYWNYAGSDSQPPCDAAERFVMARAATVDKGTLDEFKTVFAENAQPVRSLEGRIVGGPRNFAAESADETPTADEGNWR